jgi:hypothetical protein
MATLKDFINHPEDQTKEEWADYLKLINTVYDFKSSIQGYNVEIRSYNSTSQISKRLAYNSDGLLNCLPQPGLLLNPPPKSMREKFNPLIKFCATRTVHLPGQSQ